MTMFSIDDVLEMHAFVYYIQHCSCQCPISVSYQERPTSHLSLAAWHIFYLFSYVKLPFE